MEITEINEPNFPLNDKVQKIVNVDPSSYLDLIKRVSPNDFEDIIEEWLWTCHKNKYQKICRLGGTGDKGRDVIGYKDYTNNIWENYQCKNYKDKLRPSDIWLEIGKLCYRCFKKELSVPEKYFFVCPFGVSSTLNDLLRNAIELKSKLIKNWDSACKNKLLEGQIITLDGDFKTYVTNFNFNIFDYITPQEFISEYSQTKYFARRFGILTTPRPVARTPPEELEANESVYIKKILDAYGDYLHKNIDNYKKLDNYPELKKDFERQRKCFFSADSLNEFSRDISDPAINNFENLKNEIYAGVIDTVQEDAENGFARLKKVLKRAEDLQITDNPLTSNLSILDRRGICHHLANENDEVVWKK